MGRAHRGFGVGSGRRRGRRGRAAVGRAVRRGARDGGGGVRPVRAPRTRHPRRAAGGGVRSDRAFVVAVLLAVAALAPAASAKKFRFAAGPKPVPDTSLAVAEVSVEPIVRARGPRVPPTHLQLLALVAN